jgi:hypothetical protein
VHDGGQVRQAVKQFLQRRAVGDIAGGNGDLGAEFLQLRLEFRRR